MTTPEEANDGLAPVTEPETNSAASSFGRVRDTDIDREMRNAYLDYAMSVIVSRALPDARDGLKPVQRRILYVMYDTGARHRSLPQERARGGRRVGQIPPSRRQQRL